MNREITFATKILFLSSIIVMTIPCSYAVEWSPDVRLTTHGDADWNPSIASTTSGEIWVVWRSNRMGPYTLFYRVFDGDTWSGDMQLTTDPHDDDNPSAMQATDGSIWVVWESNRNEHDYNLYYKVFDGDTWSGDMQLTTDTNADFTPSITQASDGKIWVVWTSNRTIDTEIFYKVYDGVSWSSEMQVTNDSSREDWAPSIMEGSNGMIWVAFIKTWYDFEKDQIKTQDIYYKLFNGTSWLVDTRLTFTYLPHERNPSIMQAGDGKIWVLWDASRVGEEENIWYKVFDEFWSLDTELTNHVSADVNPSITQAIDQTIWVVWGSVRLSNFDIYYRTGMVSPTHDVAILEVTTSPDLALRGQTVSIEVTAQNQGTYAETFQVQCHVNSTLIGYRTIFLSAGQSMRLYPFYWNTTGAPRGIYIIKATASPVPGEAVLSDNSQEAGEPVEIRVTGDICGMYNRVLLPIPNGVVDLDDVMAVTMPGHLYTEEPDWDPIWGPACDVNKDGRVGIGDLILIGLHFGET